MRLLPHFFLILLLSLVSNCSPATQPSIQESGALTIGADRLDEYVPRIKGKHVGIVANQTSVFDSSGTHLVDGLIALGVDVDVVFAPEHGFRGEAGAGEKIQDGKDAKTGVRIVSLYGKKRKPSQEDLAGLDAVIFDIQDVGVRFYTYISTLQLVMEASADAGIPVVVLDRPNPNGSRIDGPVLEPALKSFVGISPIPVLHGLTVGEFARMSIGEGWLGSNRTCSLQVVKMSGYSHSLPYTVPVAPSPNLRTANAIRLYPSLCFFEGTVVSIGRGTDFPFEVYGFPGYPAGNMEFTPAHIPGVAPHPPFEGKMCSGIDLRHLPDSSVSAELELSYLLDAYRKYPDQTKFFNSFFENLAGTPLLRKQIEKGMDEEEIRSSWKRDLDRYREMRKKYLLYPD